MSVYSRPGNSAENSTARRDSGAEQLAGAGRVVTPRERRAFTILAFAESLLESARTPRRERKEGLLGLALRAARAEWRRLA